MESSGNRPESQPEDTSDEACEEIEPPMTVVELKRQRTALKLERKTLADAIRERDLNDDEQASFEALSTKIDDLSKRIEMLEKVEDDDDNPDEKKPEGETECDDDPKKEMGLSPKPKTSTRHLDFPAGNIATSKTRKDSHTYSLQRALSAYTENKRVTGLEGERSQEIAIRSGNVPGGFFMPLDFKVRGNHRMKRRDFTTSTGTGAVGVQVESTFIELLRNRMVTDELGVTVTHSLVGKYAKPRQNAASVLYYIGEGSTTTPSNPTFDQVNFVPRTAACQVNISRKSLFEMSIDAETAVESDMLKVLAIGLDTAVLAGPGTGAGPTGIIYDPNALTIALTADSANGGAISFQDAMNFESILTGQNADRGQVAFVTTPQVRSKLKQAPKINSGQVYPEFIWAPDNTVNGYKALVTNEMPSGFTKGSSGATLHSIIFGNFEDAELALWGGIDIVINPYINVSSGAVQYNLFQEMDTQRMHSNSFVISTSVVAV